MISQLNDVIFYVILCGMASEGEKECAVLRSGKQQKHNQTEGHKERKISRVLTCMNFLLHRTS
jgi:hypothetical protein